MTSVSELVERLRDDNTVGGGGRETMLLCDQAADLIEAQADAIARKDAALRETDRLVTQYAEFFCEEDYDPLVDTIRAALANTPAQQEGGR